MQSFQFKLTFLLCFAIFSIQAKPESKDYCVSLQGNGRAIYSHFGAMAYLVEAHGIPQGISGGSSATVSMFILESILLNPALRKPNSDRVDLDDKQTIAKVAFLLKSIVGLGNFMDTSIPVGYLSQHEKIFETAQELVTKLQQNPDSLPDVLEGLKEHDARLEWLKNYGSSLLNQKTLSLLYAGIRTSGIDGPGPSWFIDDMKRALSAEKLFQFEDMRDFIRPFPIKFDGLAQMFGSIGDFYAGNSFAYQSFEKNGQRNDLAAVDRFSELFTACEATNVERWWGKTYSDPQVLPAGCSAVFEKMLADHFGSPDSPEKLAFEFKVPLAKQRRFATIGSSPSLSVLPVVAMLSGNAATDLNALKHKYDAFSVLGGPATQEANSQAFDFQILPKDLKYGYFATLSDRKILSGYFAIEHAAYTSSQPNEGGLKGSQSQVLDFHRPVLWNRVLTTSPAEPTIASFTEFSADDVAGGPYASLSGWGGLFDVFPLKAIGCKETVYVTTRQFADDGELGFAFPRQITKAFVPDVPKADGSDSDYKNHIKEMYSLVSGDDHLSSHERNLKAADLVMCTSWNSDEIWGMDFDKRKKSFLDAYLQSRLVGAIQKRTNGGLLTSQRLKVAERALSGHLAPVGCQK